MFLDFLRKIYCRTTLDGLAMWQFGKPKLSVRDNAKKYTPKHRVSTRLAILPNRC